MSHTFIIDSKFFQHCSMIDYTIAVQIQTERCPHCGGRLDRADYPRKPRGGLIAAAGENETRRISLCCSRDGCRKRVTPPSVLFLGRKVYLSAAIIISSMKYLETSVASIVETLTGIAVQTIRRWGHWWRDRFWHSPFFKEAQARLPPPVDPAFLPTCIFERFSNASSTEENLFSMLQWLMPITTVSARLDRPFYKSFMDTQKMMLGMGASPMNTRFHGPPQR